MKNQKPPKKPVPPCFRYSYGKADIAALQALERGDATPEQQKRALDWIINQGAMTYQDVWDDKDDRASSFMSGRRFVGLRVVTLLRINLKDFRGEQTDG